MCVAEIQEELDGLQTCVDVVSFVGPSNFLEGAWEEELRHSADRFNQQYLRYTETRQEYPHTLFGSGGLEGDWQDPAEAHARVVRRQTQEQHSVERAHRGFLHAGAKAYNASFKVCRWGPVFKTNVDKCILNIRSLQLAPQATHVNACCGAVRQFLNLLNMSFILEPAGSESFYPYDWVRPRTLSTPWHDQWKLTLQQVKRALVDLTAHNNTEVKALFRSYRAEKLECMRKLTAPVDAGSWGGRWCAVSADADALCMRELLESI